MKLTILGVLILIFGAFAISRAALRFRGREISLANAIFWITIWIVIMIAILFPDTTVELARVIGIGRGTDSAFLISILLLFYLVFRIYVKMDNVDKDVTELSKKISQEFHMQNKDKKP
ncbi:MAG: DUF2304 family protein [Candidatus Pacebacteria bacterium]|nr:DUF2304 family protein [Candidatus Paceibacterota bacterium]MDR3583412.1 DUF2304 family protein [Candidatus Paceibacterota bacterium]